MSEEQSGRESGQEGEEECKEGKEEIIKARKKRQRHEEEVKIVGDKWMRGMNEDGIKEGRIKEEESKIGEIRAGGA